MSQQQPNGLQTTRYAEHVKACALLANEVATILDLRDDVARQACYATLIISADRHNLFLDPHPQHSKTPVIQPEAAAASNGLSKKVDQVEAAAVTETPSAAEIDERRARNADQHASEAIRNPTPAQAETAKRTVLLDGIDKGRNLLNKEGYLPIMTPKALNDCINNELLIEGNLGTLDGEQLELVIRLLATKLDTFKANKKALEADAPF